MGEFIEKAKGSVYQTLGKAKVAAGRRTNDTGLMLNGAGQQIKGKGQKISGAVKGAKGNKI